MMTNTLLFRVDPADLPAALDEARAAFERSQDSEVMLDLAALARIDTAGVAALVELARAAADRNVRLRARGVNVAVYKVLRLAGAADGIAFATD